jgi:uncharacterized membrane protein (DUF373 family)
MAAEQSSPPNRSERWLTLAETVLYTVIAVLLAVAAFVLLGAASIDFLTALGEGSIGRATLEMLNQLLLVLMLAELLYTVRASLREHTLIAEPFLVIGLIAGVRRVLVITAEAWNLGEAHPDQFMRAMLELGLLTVMTLVIVVSIVLLRRNPKERSV